MWVRFFIAICHHKTESNVHVLVSKFLNETILIWFLFNKSNRRTNFPNLFLSKNSTCFGQFLCPSSGVFHCTFCTGVCHAGMMTAFKHDQDGRARKLSSYLHDICQCRMYIGKLLMMGRGTARNMWNLLTKINLGN